MLVGESGPTGSVVAYDMLLLWPTCGDLQDTKNAVQIALGLKLNAQLRQRDGRVDIPDIDLDTLWPRTSDGLVFIGGRSPRSTSGQRDAYIGASTSTIQPPNRAVYLRLWSNSQAPADSNSQTPADGDEANFRRVFFTLLPLLLLLLLLMVVVFNLSRSTF